jgi:hypothetical protein
MRYKYWQLASVTVPGLLGIFAPLWTVVISDSTSAVHTRLTMLALYFGIGSGIAIFVFASTHFRTWPRYVLLLISLGVVNIVLSGFFLWLIIFLCGATVLWGDCRA